MKLSIILLLLTILNAFAGKTYSQNTLLKLDMENAPLRDVLEKIENQSEFFFLYSSKMVDVNQKVDVHLADKKINEILDKIVEGKDLKYVIKDRQILLVNKTTNVTDQVQQSALTGTVSDANTGEVLPGVNVIIEGTLVGTTTDIDGRFSLQNPSQNAVLVFSFIGYLTEKVTYSGQTTLEIKLKSDVQTLSEVLVTGYSIEKKKDIIGSVAVVDMNNLKAQTAGNITSALQGRVPGITITSSGTPGTSGRVRIRGFGSFGSSEPLYIIDGVPGNVERMNPDEIESIQVLKDAASAAVYGARASNGVIIITTKQGKSNSKVTVELSSYYGTNYPLKNNQMCDAVEFGELYWNRLKGAGRNVGDSNWGHAQYGKGPEPVIPEYILVNDITNGVRYGGTALEALKTSNPTLFESLVDPSNYNFETHQIVKSANTDWFDEVYNPSPIQNHQLTISGGTDKLTYAISGNYFNETATESKYGYYKRYSLRANSNLKVGKSINVGENLQVSYRDWNDASEAYGAWVFHPLIPVYDIMGNPASSAAQDLNNWGASVGRNPVTESWRQRFDTNESYGIFGDVFMEVAILKNLTAKTLFGIDYSNSSFSDFSYKSTEHWENTTTNDLKVNVSSLSNWVWTNTLRYAKEFNNQKFSVLLGSEASRSFYQMLGGRRYNFGIQDDPDFLVLNTGTASISNEGYFDRSSLFSLFGRFDYDYAGKYIFNATLRRDGSSKFGKNNRYGYFPSAAIGWRVSSENFMQDITWLTDLKLRASYGIIGNQAGLPNDNSYFTYTISDQYSYAITGANSIAYPFSLYKVGDPNIRWEKTASANFGLDATILDGKFSFSAEYYIKRTTDLLVQNQAPSTGTMAIQPYINVGDMENKGIELNLINRGKLGSDFNYEVGVIFSKYENNVIKILDNPKSFLNGYGTSQMANINRTMAGYPIAMFYGFKRDGFINSQEELDAYKETITSTWLTPAIGRWKIKDINNDGKINDDDRTFLGSPHPDFQMSLDISLTYKNFDFYSFLFWNQGGQVFNLVRNWIDFNLGTFNRSKRALYDVWTPENHNALLPKSDIDDLVSNKYPSDYYIEDISYLRMRTLQLGYTVPQSIISKINLEKLRIYVQAQNLFTICDKSFTGLDPDAGLSGTLNRYGMTNDLQMGVFNNATHTPKQIIFGINVTF